MDEKCALEDFRVRQHAGTHPALAAAAAAAAVDDVGPVATAEQQADSVAPDTGRVIILFDVDSFYCQVEELRNPALRGRPLGVTQKYLIVTCNYAAREHGVTKLMGTAEARKRCPHIALVSGEDLTPYRAASKSILAVLQRFGTTEKGGLDEFWLDATNLVKRRLAALGRAAPLPPWHGHVHSSALPLLQDSRHRPMDLRAASAGSVSSSTGISAAAACPAGLAAEAGTGAAPRAALPAPAALTGGKGGGGGDASEWEVLLRIGSAIAAEARTAVKTEAGFRTSAGIACNKMLSKLCSGLHKPDDQTVMPPPEAAAFVAPLPVRALPGVGYKLEAELMGMGVATALQLRALPRAQLVQRFGERTGGMLHAACRGQDPSPVQEKGRQKSVTVEDSCKSCAGFAAAEKVVAVLAPDLLARLHEELEDGGRRPATLTVKWRHRGTGWQRASGSCPMPSAVLSKAVPPGQQVAALASAALGLLRRNLHEPFDLTLINLGATSFSESGAAGSRNIAAMIASGHGCSETSSHAGAGAGAAHAADGPAATAAAPTSAWQQPGGVPLASPKAAWAVAQASMQQRRSYSAAAALAPLLSKRHERQLREQGGLGPGEPHLGGTRAEHLPPAAPAGDGGGGRAGEAAAAAGAVQHDAGGRPWPCRQPQPPEQPCYSDGYFGQEEDEDEGEGMWDDLRRLAAWRSGGGTAGAAGEGSEGRGRSSPALGPPPQPGQLADAWQHAAAVPADGNLAPAGTAAPAGRLSGRGSPDSSSRSSRVIIHADVDAFYVQVERLDDSSLVGVPVAVQQFNAGGFVAVSYEARAAGIRCGDGAGAAGRAAIPHLRNMQAASLEECRRRCPGLQVRPMRTHRYREVSQQVHDLLRSLVPDCPVERTSYDDCYMDVTAACAAGVASGPQRRQQQAQQGPSTGREVPPPAGLLWVSCCAALGSQQGGQLPPNLQAPQQAAVNDPGGRWAVLAPDMQRGVQLAAALRAAAKERLGLTISCGVARSRLVARLASPLGKPDGLTVVPDAEAVAFMRSMPLHKVPTLRGKFGQEVASQLGISSVAQLAVYSRAELVHRFGEQQGAFLAGLPLAQDDTPVRERGPQKSILVERSFPPLPSEAAAGQELEPLARALLERAAQDTHEHRRLPCKLVVSYRQGYGSNPRSRSCPVPAEALRWLDAWLAGPTARAASPVDARRDAALPAPQHAQQGAVAGAGAVPAPAPVGAVVAAALAQLRTVTAPHGWQLTRLAVALAYDSGSSGLSTASLPGQQGIAAFVLKGRDGNNQPKPVNQSRPDGSSQPSAEPAAPREGGFAAAGSGSIPQADDQAAPPLAQTSAPTAQHSTARLPERQLAAAVPPRAGPEQRRVQGRAASSARPPSYRNAEALALERMFRTADAGTSGSGQPAKGVDSSAGCAAVAWSGLPPGLPPEERASLELALKLQAEEAAAAAASGEARKRAAGKPPAASKVPKQQRRGSGPLDAFLQRAKS